MSERISSMYMTMKLSAILAGLAITLTVPCFAQQINPITKAMLDGYEEILKENPKDYQTLFERASQYYQLGQFDNAFNDIAKALQNTPEKDTEMWMREYGLLADISIAAKDYEKALSATEKALTIKSDSYPDLYKKGNILLYLNQPEEAYRAFSSMQRLKSRSQEAYCGMARACIMQNKLSEAKELIKEAENADPSNYITYCRVGDLYNEMGEAENAATNYIMAFSLSRNPQRPIQSLVDLSKKNYQGVATALDYAVSKTSNKVPLYFLRGNLAFNSGHFADAEKAYSELLKLNEGREAGVYSEMARTLLALDKPEEAIANISQAIILNPRADYFVTKAQALRRSGQSAAALLEAGKAMNADPNSVDAMIEYAKDAIAGLNKDAALTTLNEAVMTAPDNLEALLLRAYLYDNILSNGKQAVMDYNRAAAMPAENFPDAAYKAIAKAKSGKKLDADAIVEAALKDHSDNESLYYAAVYYAQTGGLQKAQELLEKAVSKGYSNLYNLKSNNEANLNIAPARHLLKQ